MSEHPTEHEEAGGSQTLTAHHGIPPFVYYRVFALLMVLLVATLVAAYFDLGSWNLVIMLAVAIIKAALIFLYFMHLRFSSHLILIFAGAAFIWLSILFVMTMSDYMSRGWLPVPGR
jgi:cytochrome c oxidase subunit 4